MIKTVREKQLVIHKGNPKTLSTDFSAEILQARRNWHDIFKVLKEKISNQELYLEKLSFRIGEIKSSPDEQKLKEFIVTKHPYEKY